MNWFREQRLAWIGEMLEIYGFINRGHLMKKFGISTPQASHDFQDFQQAHPGLMVYDPREKVYRSSKALVDPLLGV